MRPYELLSSLPVLFCALALFAGPRYRGVVVIAGIVSVILLAVQAIFEGSHWQLAPLYLALGLTMGCVLATSLYAGVTPRIVSLVCILLVMASCIFCYLMPVFRLPRPTGPNKVGTRLLHLVDYARAETNGPSPSGKRELMAQAWYPASPAGDEPFAVYQRRRELTLRSSYRSVLKTNSLLNAPVHAGGPFPLILYNPGWNGERTEGTFEMEELASQGFVVVAVDHTFLGGLVAFPDGRITDSRNAPEIGNFSHSSIEQQWQLGGRFTRLEAEDDIFVLDQLAQMNLNRVDPFFGRLDLEKVGALGFSLGGAAAVEMAWLDPRVKCVVNLDGWEFGQVAKHGLAKPMMVIYEDKTQVIPPKPSLRPNQNPETDPEFKNWQFSVEDLENVTRTLSRNGGYLIYLAKSNHVNFTDRSLFSPLRRMTSGGAIDPRRAHALINQYTLAFFRQSLLGTSEKLLVSAPGNPSIMSRHESPEIEMLRFEGSQSGAELQTR